MTATIFDLHTHHDRCGHAEGKIEDYIQAAIERKLHYIGISDHSPYFYLEEDQPHPGIAMAKSELDDYVNEVLKLKEKYKNKIHVLLGMESDYFPEYASMYSNICKKYPFDYIIGSVHHVHEKSIFLKGRWNRLSEQERLKEKESYYHLIQQSARSGMFQVLGHIDAMKGYLLDFHDVETSVVEETLRVIAEEGVAMEVNTSGKNKDCGGWYPSHEILERAYHYGVDISFGSDSHVPSRVADDYLEVQETLRQIGFKEMVYFVEKKRHAVPL
ncbi:histidinol-phosphatase [Oceanobacillus sp. CFH 90083]|uniref:histidinol-phosphatase n=1 Tax=Oceanobacillus sp. CFH 90083 TaxID=2592336 RepID=UPI00128C9C65|nr:histidinol-phosphatase [Oceanobacillus sp. CFH 90083]